MSSHYAGQMISQLMILLDKIVDSLVHLLDKTLTLPLPRGVRLPSKGFSSITLGKRIGKKQTLHNPTSIIHIREFN